MSASSIVSGVVVSYAASLLVDTVDRKIGGQTLEEAEFIQDVRQAANETAEDFEGVTEEMLVLVLKSEEVRRYAEDFVAQSDRKDSEDELPATLETVLSEVIDSELDIDTKRVTEEFIQNLQQQVVDNPDTWENILNQYDDDISEEMSEVQKEIHRQLFNEIESLREERREVQNKSEFRFKINVMLGVLSLGLAILSAYLSYITLI
jgi:hypothetical protein